MKAYITQSESLVTDLINRECKTIILESICGLFVHNEMIYRPRPAISYNRVPSSNDFLTYGLSETDYIEVADSSDISYICSEYQRRKVE